MNRILLLALPLLALAACNPRTGYVDMTKAMNDTAEGKAASASLNAFATEKRQAIAAAQGEVKRLVDAKADAPVIAAAQKKADDLANAAQAELKQRQDAEGAKISAGLARILPKLREAHNFAAISPKPLDVAPDLEVTAELVSRYNAGEGVEPPPPETPAVTQKKLADLEQKVRAFEAAKSMTGAAVVASNGRPTTIDHKGATQ